MRIRKDNRPRAFSCVNMLHMSRNTQAQVLLVVLLVSTASNVLQFVCWGATRALSASRACCSGFTCRMHSKPAAMPDSFLMGSGTRASTRAVNCSCSVSHDESSTVPNTQTHLRFDVPCTTSLPRPSFSQPEASQTALSCLSGYASPPDQPPETSS